MENQIKANTNFLRILENHELKRIVILRGYTKIAFGYKEGEVIANFFAFQSMLQGRIHKSINISNH